MYDFMFVDPETMIEEEYFTATKTFVQEYSIRSTPQLVPKHLLVFGYIISEDYGLDLNFDETEKKRKS